MAHASKSNDLSLDVHEVLPRSSLGRVLDGRERGCVPGSQEFTYDHDAVRFRGADIALVIRSVISSTEGMLHVLQFSLTGHGV